MEKENKSILFIINPKAGIKKKLNLDLLIQNWADEHELLIEIKNTEYVNHAYQISKLATSQKYSLVAGVGGDGTINEIARGLIDSRIPLGIIPMGSGNGLARHLKIPLKLNESLNNLISGVEEPLDIMQINEKLSINVSGIGFDAQVAHKFAQMNGRGFKNYLKAVIYEYYQSEEFVVEIIDKHEQKTKVISWLVSICNASQFGNQATIAAGAMCNDGLIDFIFLRKPKLYQIPKLAYQIFTKKLHHSLLIFTLRTKELILKFEGQQPLHVDGEIFYANGEVKCWIPFQIGVIAPK